MAISIPVLSLNDTNSLADFALLDAEQWLRQQLNIELGVHTENTVSFADLLDPEKCDMIISAFLTRVSAANSTCAASMLIKYWSVIFLYPFLYSMLHQKPFMHWNVKAFSMQMGSNWHWDRHLNLKQNMLIQQKTMLKFTQFSDFSAVIFADLKQIFDSISRVAKVPTFVLWENTSLRILQFFDQMLKKSIQNQWPDDIRHNLAECEQQFMELSPDLFGLKFNPLALLKKDKDTLRSGYLRQKCCFYFMLPESEGDYCSSCPLRQPQEAIA